MTIDKSYFKNPLKSFCVVSLFVAAVVSSSFVLSQNSRLFDQDSALDAVLTVPLTQAYNAKAGAINPYFSGQLSYKGGGEDVTRLPLKVRPRGNFRRANCDMPPLRLNFPKKAVKGTLFHGQDKLKLVGPCKPGGIYQDLVGLEFLAYQVFASVSDYAFDTRLMNLNFVDSDKKLKPRSTTAFVIEHASDLAKRTNLKDIDPDKAKRTELDLQETALLEIFSLFIANNDYSTLIGMPGDTCCHNVQLLEPSEPGAKLIPVPYDFDMSGLVNAPYAAPPGTLPILKVRQRYFSGWCKSTEYFDAAVEKFKSKEATIMGLVDSASYLSSSAKKRTKKYFNEFYEMVGDSERYENEVINRCRGNVIN